MGGRGSKACAVSHSLIERELRRSSNKPGRVDLSRPVGFEQYLEHRLASAGDKKKKQASKQQQPSGVTSNGDPEVPTMLDVNTVLDEVPKAVFDNPAIASRILHLSADFHLIQTLPTGIAQLRNLRSLSLRANRLSSLPQQIGELHALESLDLHCNRLTAAGLPPALFSLPHLRRLDLGDNRIAGAFPAQVSGLRELRALNLNSNELESLPCAELASLPHLSLLLCHLNRCKDPPQQACAEGSAALLTAIRARAAGGKDEEKGKAQQQASEQKQQEKEKACQSEESESWAGLPLMDDDIGYVIPAELGARFSPALSPAQLARLVDRVAGCVFGAALGDAIGLSTEFLSRDEAAFYYNRPLLYEQIVRDRHRVKFERGDWTDDTDQMLVIWRAVESGSQKLAATMAQAMAGAEKRPPFRLLLDERELARGLQDWVAHGFPELGDQCGWGLGNTVGSTLRHSLFNSHPLAAARQCFTARGRKDAANGAVMRTAVLAVLHAHEPAAMTDATLRACLVTHSSPRCVASCVYVVETLAALLRGDLDAEEKEKEGKEKEKGAKEKGKGEGEKLAGSFSGTSYSARVEAFVQSLPARAEKAAARAQAILAQAMKDSESEKKRKSERKKKGGSERGGGEKDGAAEKGEQKESEKQSESTEDKSAVGQEKKKKEEEEGSSGEKDDCNLNMTAAEASELASYVRAGASLADLKLDDPRAIGYTFKPVGCAFYGLRAWARSRDGRNGEKGQEGRSAEDGLSKPEAAASPSSSASASAAASPSPSPGVFERVITDIAFRAGDADTNAVVAGALTGAAVGYSQLPAAWVNGLRHPRWLAREVERMLNCVVAARLGPLGLTVQDVEGWGKAGGEEEDEEGVRLEGDPVCVD